MTVIADAIRPVGLAGVMGGHDTEVGPETTDIFIEAANFVPSRTRRTRRLAGLSTDASYRFERGVDAALAPRRAGACRATGDRAGRRPRR